MTTLTADLALLETKGLVRVAHENGKPIVRFKHALTREATYNSILQSRRSELHYAVARTLTELYATRDLELTLTLADHWLRAGVFGKTLETLLPRARDLIVTGRSSSLISLLLQIDPTVLNAAQQFDLEFALADAYTARGEYHQARPLYENLLPRAETDAVRARVLQALGVTAYHLGDYNRALEHHHASLALAQALDDFPHQARALSGLGITYLRLGDTTTAEQHIQSSRVLSLELGETPETGNAEYNLALVLYSRGDYAAALAVGQRVLELDIKYGQTTLAARSLQLLGACYYGLGDLDAAARDYRQALETSRALGDLHAVTGCLSNLAELYTDLGDLDQAVSYFEQAIDASQMLKLDDISPFNLTGLAHVRQLQAQDLTDAAEANTLLARAHANVAAALEIAEQIHSQEREGVARRVLAEIFWAHHDLVAARHQAQIAVQLLEKAGPALELKRAHQTLGRVLAVSPET